MEQQPLFNALNFSAGVIATTTLPLGYANTTVGYTQLTGLLCPSDGQEKHPGGDYGTMNYMGNTGDPGTHGRSTMRAL